MAHCFACDLFGGAFFTSGDGIEAQEFFDTELSKFAFYFFYVAMADGYKFLGLPAVADFAEVGFGAVQLVSLNASAHRSLSAGLVFRCRVFVCWGACS